MALNEQKNGVKAQEVNKMATIGGEVKCKKCGGHTLWEMQVITKKLTIVASGCKCNISDKDKAFNKKYMIEL